MSQRAELVGLARLFLWLGITGFGGPAAHIALMREEVVVRRRWLTTEEFLDLLAITNLIPGPNSTEMAMHIGQVRAGWRGLVVAGACFILPAALITGTLGWAYVRFGSLPVTSELLYGVKPVIIAVLGQALWDFLPKALKTTRLTVLGVGLVALYAAGVDELVLLLLGGVGAIVTERTAAALGALALLVQPGRAWAATGAEGVGITKIFLIFLKIGSVLFGSGYVLLAFLRADLVEGLGWLTERQLLDAVAVGQVTPGPVFTTATFIGYVLAGVPGAVVATVGIFLPAFVCVAAVRPVVPWMRRSRVAGAFLDGLNVASLALLAAVCAQLARTAIVDLPTGIAAVGSAVALVKFRVRSSLLLVLGAAAGVIHGMYH